MSSNNNNMDSLPMNGGNGTHSYSKNSTFQREASIIVKALIKEVIAEKLDTENISSTSNTLHIADLGCSQYFAAAVPGSFHARLFPKASLHIVHSSYALHWLSKVPEDIVNKDSPSWNKGKIYYTSASDEVASAYVAQFDRDVDEFLNAGAVEIVTAGLILLLTTAAADELCLSHIIQGWAHDAFGSSLMEKAKELKWTPSIYLCTLSAPMTWLGQWKEMDVLELRECN
ncbi:Loganic acid O-methyltransferase [Camellia lanceoleosa]|uniref:Loganic acid O-methyltransferase n=1 Tax=Camellia lanceoleosa TaxID=1840588 RepID=A0ACC0FY80_9ERIC|nr:Loganic acid O-methyltransferase [Camellia lanceoleosa]